MTIIKESRVALNAREPEYKSQFIYEKINFVILLSDPALEQYRVQICNCLEGMVGLQSGRNWCAKNGVLEKLSEIVVKYVAAVSQSADMLPERKLKLDITIY